jgi:hypothetical protein
MRSDGGRVTDSAGEVAANKKGATKVAPSKQVVLSSDYGFFLVVSIFFVVSIIFMDVSIFIPVSVTAGAGAGAIAGVAVSVAAFSDLEQAVAVTASTAATKARRFMTFS